MKNAEENMRSNSPAEGITGHFILSPSLFCRMTAEHPCSPIFSLLGVKRYYPAFAGAHYIQTLPVMVPEKKQLRNWRFTMKKTLTFVGAAFAAIVMTGCAGITTNNGAVSPISAGPNFYSEVSANAMIQPVSGDYEVVKRDVTASAVLKSYFTAVNIGDVSYATLKAAALKQAPGAQDLVDVKMDYSMKNICGINEVTVTLTATAVKFKK